MINLACHQGAITGVKVAWAVHVTHLLFVDNVLLFGAGSKKDWFHFHKILMVFCDASGLNININKSSFYYQCDDVSVRSYIAGLFPFAMNGLEAGIWYLGFIIKSDSYQIMDSNWMVRKVSRRINSWASRWLTLGGRLILT